MEKIEKDDTLSLLVLKGKEEFVENCSCNHAFTACIFPSQQPQDLFIFELDPIKGCLSGTHPSVKSVRRIGAFLALSNSWQLH